jgi:signal recognition particle receptor subunit beta
MNKSQIPNPKSQIISKFQLKIPIILFVLVVVIACTKSDYNPNLVEYIKAEKELRSRITEEQGLSDSIKILQQKYNIDLEEELSKLSDNPEDWIKLLKDLKIAK